MAKKITTIFPRTEIGYAVIIVILALACGFFAFQAQEAQQKASSAMLALSKTSAQALCPTVPNYATPTPAPSPTPTATPQAFNACTAVKDSSPLFPYYCKSQLFSEFVQLSPEYTGDSRLLDAANLTALAEQQPAVYANLSITAMPVFEIRLAGKTKAIGMLILFDNNGKILKEVPLQLVKMQ